MPDARTVAVARGDGHTEYPVAAPFRPAEHYPELGGRVPAAAGANAAYALFRELLALLDLDVARRGTARWNPFAGVVHPGQRVLIKPNIVRHVHMRGGDYRAVVTHASVVRCVLDYVALALGGDGVITVGDSPVQSTDFARALERTGLRGACDDVSACWGMPVELVDFRRSAIRIDGAHRVTERIDLAGDPRGYHQVDLGMESALMPIIGGCEKFRVTNYDPGEMEAHHNETTNEYLVPRTVLDADVVINVPKLKTHRKVGLTAALKNLVGINGQKDWLPHHRAGSRHEGGDEYLNPSHLKKLKTRMFEAIDKNPFSGLNELRRFTLRAAGAVNRYTGADRYVEGSWYGNDTCWRMVHDLNRLLVYAGADGRMTNERQRDTFTIVDGIIAGEGEGPMSPTARAAGILVAGANPVAVDAVIATLIGFDYRKLPLVRNGFERGERSLADFRPDEIDVRSDVAAWNALAVGSVCDDDLHFVPPSGWKGNVELPRPVPST
jgi:uncharacterized protein (DUF362 family)